MAAPAPDHGIVLWTLIVAVAATAIALGTAIIAFITARYAKGAIDPLEKTVTGLEEVAGRQDESIRTAERIHESEKLLREIKMCGKVLDALLSISLIEVRAAAAAAGDPHVTEMRQEDMFLVAKSQLLVALQQLPRGLLTEAERVTRVPDFSGLDIDNVTAARQEVTRKLAELQGKLPALGSSGLSTARRKPKLGPGSKRPGYHGKPISWASVIIIIIGFIVGGAGLVFGPTWWLFGTGAGLVILGGIIALGTGIFNDWY